MHDNEWKTEAFIFATFVFETQSITERALKIRDDMGRLNLLNPFVKGELQRGQKDNLP